MSRTPRIESAPQARSSPREVLGGSPPGSRPNAYRIAPEMAKVEPSCRARSRSSTESKTTTAIGTSFSSTSKASAGGSFTYSPPDAGDRQQADEAERN
jgi:hypothetical protein